MENTVKLEPLVEILENIPTCREYKPVSQDKSVTQSLNTLFPEQEIENKKIKSAKEILGKIAQELSESELKDVIAQVEFLSESWLDDFEKSIFDGETLTEVLHERATV